MEPSSPAGRRWPWGIAIGMLVAIMVNVVFAYVAIAGRDQVVSSYTTEPR